MVRSLVVVVSLFFYCMAWASDPFSSQFPSTSKKNTALEPPRWAFIPKEAMTNALTAMSTSSTTTSSDPAFSVDFPDDSSGSSSGDFFSMGSDE